MRLQGKVALVTGASRRIGKAISIRLAEEGARVACAATRVEHNKETIATITARGGEAVSLAVDLRDPQTIVPMLERAVALLGPVDILVNNAATSILGSVLDLSASEWDEVMTVNTRSIFLCSQWVARAMRDQGRGGVIINVGSIAGINAFPGRIAYGTSKAALHHMTKIMAIDLAELGIRVNCVAPGYIDHTEETEFVRRGLLDLAALRRRIPQHRIGEGRDIAAAVAYLASDESRYVTGSILVVDGGFTAYGFV
jgi:NAD(P)-dependent dehydrogenase (short-subunit alcohol dehydrogenase family)